MKSALAVGDRHVPPTNRARDESVRMNAAETAFRDVTRAAYAAFASSPPVISYRITAHERDQFYDRNVRYAEVYDSRSGMTQRRDITFRETAYERPFLAAPNLDAVGAFNSSLTSDRHGVVFTAYAVDELNLASPTAPPGVVDAWTAANGAYVARFDARDPTGGTLELTATDRYGSDHQGWTLARIRMDPATKLPVHVEMRSPDDGRFVLDYQTVAGHRVLAKVSFDEDARLFLNGEPARGSANNGREHVHFDGTYDQYAFPSPSPAP